MFNCMLPDLLMKGSRLDWKGLQYNLAHLKPSMKEKESVLRRGSEFSGTIGVCKVKK